MPSNNSYAQLIISIPFVFLKLISNMILPASTQSNLPTADQSFIVDARDAEQNVAENDMRYLLSQVVFALQQFNLNADEIQQFLEDLKRLSTVTCNGIKADTSNPQLLLDTWASDMANKSKLSIDQVRATISIFNQSVGNGAFEILMRFTKNASINGAEVLAYLPLPRSPLRFSNLSRDGNKLSLHYQLPFAAFAMPDSDEPQDIKQDPEPDALANSVLSLDLDAGENDPNRVTYKLEVTTLNPAFKISFPGFELFDKENRNNGFCTIEQLPDDDDWGLVKYTPPVNKPSNI